MRLFGPIYDYCLRLAGHVHAERYLYGVSLVEAIFFPVPPDFMLAPMTLAKPARWIRYAGFTTIVSIVGGLIGYLIGLFAIDVVMPWIERFGHGDTFKHVHELFALYGFWIVFVAGFTPIPYKVFTIASGAAQMALLPFLLGSLTSRGLRFFLVAGLIAWGGPKLAPQITKYIEIIGWVCAVLILGLIGWLYFRG